VIHRRVYDATVTGKAYHDVEGARTAMEDWAYPRTWIDFETVLFAAPRWVGTHPNQPIPFQFSAHVEQINGDVDHREPLPSGPAHPCRCQQGSQRPMMRKQPEPLQVGRQLRRLL
jgi:hypothetical protein